MTVWGNNKMNSEITFNDCDFYDGFFYAASDKDNSFFRFNQEKYERLYIFEDEESCECLFMQSVMVNDKIILTPSNADNIYIYDCNTANCAQVCLKDAKTIRSKFHGLLMHENYAYFIPVAYPQMVRVNIDNYEVDYIELECDFPTELGYAWETNGTMISHKLYSKFTFEMNLHDHGSILMRRNVDCDNIWGYYTSEGYEFFVTNRGIMITNGGNLIFEDRRYVLNRGIYLFTPYIYDDKVLFFPFSTGGHTSAVPIVVEKTENGNYVLHELNGGVPTSFHCIKEYNGKLYMLRNNDCSVVVFDLEQESFDVYIKGALKRIEQERNSFELKEWINLQLM